MEKSNQYTLASLCLAVMVIMSPLQGCSKRASGNEGAIAQTAHMQQPDAEAIEKAEREQLRAECQANIEAKKAEYKRLWAAKNYWGAAIHARQCADVLDDPVLRTMVSDGEIRSYLADIKNTKLPLFDRAQRIERMRSEYPKEAKLHEATFRRIMAEYAPIVCFTPNYAAQQSLTHWSACKRSAFVGLGVSGKN